MSSRNPSNEPVLPPGSACPTGKQNAVPGTFPTLSPPPDHSSTPHPGKEHPVNHAHAVRRPASTAAPQTPKPTRRLDPQMRAAAILGRIIYFFDAVDACPAEALERTRRLLVEELDVARSDALRAPHEHRRRNAVFTAALACVQAASERAQLPDAGHPPLVPATDDQSVRPMRPGQVILRIHHVLDGVRTLQDPTPPDGRARGVDVLAHMLRGPEPRNWTRDQQDFARCALEWMRAGVDAGEGLRRWSNIGRRNRGPRPGHGDSAGVILSA